MNGDSRARPILVDEAILLRRLGVILRQYRLQAGLTRRQLAGFNNNLVICGQAFALARACSGT